MVCVRVTSAHSTACRALSSSISAAVLVIASPRRTLTEPVDHLLVAQGDVMQNHAHGPVLAGHHGRPLPLGAGFDEGDGFVVGRLQLLGQSSGADVVHGPSRPPGTTATVTSISTAPPRGKAATPMADRV